MIWTKLLKTMVVFYIKLLYICFDKAIQIIDFMKKILILSFILLPFISIFQGLTQPNITAVVSSQVGVNEQGEILGINQSIQSLGMSIPPIVAGFINLVNPNLPIAAASLCTILGWLVLVLFFKNKKEKDAFIK